MRRVRDVTAPLYQPLNGDVFVKGVPVYATGRKFIVVALLGRGVKQPRKPGQRYAKRAIVREFNPHGGVIEPDVSS